jgi:Ser/Thr protein kinase RdoA (MazF antagonist)
MDIDLRKVLTHYDLGEPVAFWRMERGFINDDWESKTTQGYYFLKHYHPDLRHPRAIRTRHALVAHLRQAGFPAPAVIPTASGDTLLALEDELYEIQEYIEGTPYDYSRPEHFQEAARTLGRYHACVKGFAPQALRDLGELYSPAILRVNLTDLADAWELDHDAELAQIVRRLEAHADDLAARFAAHGALPHLVTHGDYYADNLLFERGRDSARIVGVVDYDKARWQPRVGELSEALIYFASPRPGHLKHLVYPGFLEWESFERFLSHYGSVVKPNESEIHALPDYIRCIWLQVSLQRLGEKGARPVEAPEALHEVLTLGEWAEASTEKMVDAGKQVMRDP